MEEEITFDQLPQAVVTLTKEVSDLRQLLLQKRESQGAYTEEQLLTVDELADFLHLSKPTIYSNYSKGLIPGGCKQGKRVLFDKKIVLDWIRSGRKLTNQEIEAQASKVLNHNKSRK